MKLTVLGVSAPFARPDDPCSGYLLQHGHTSIWVDAGSGTLAELQRHIDLSQLDAIWISHSHADHTSDLLTAYYALRFGDVSLDRPVALVGPAGLVDRLVGFLGHRSTAIIPEVFEITEMRGWSQIIIGEITLGWGPVNHGMPAFGLRAEAGGSVLTFSGDTSYCEGLVELAEGADLFVCEAGAATTQRADVHCTPEDAARAASEAGVKRLVLTHIDRTHIGRDPYGAEAVSRARIGFAETQLARPGMSWELSI